MTYGQTEILLLFGKVVGEAYVRDVQEMVASNVGLRMMTEEAVVKGMPLIQNFIRTLHKTILREDYTVYRNLLGEIQTSYVIHAGQYKARPNSVQKLQNPLISKKYVERGEKDCIWRVFVTQ